MKVKSLKLSLVLLLIIIFSFALIGCNNNRLVYGTYIDENSPDSSVVITEDYIKCVNVDFTQLNEDIKKDLNVDMMLNTQMNREKEYTYKDGKITVNIMTGIELSFDYSNKKIKISQAEYTLKE